MCAKFTEITKNTEYSHVFVVKSWIRVCLSTKRPLLNGEKNQS